MSNLIITEGKKMYFLAGYPTGQLLPVTILGQRKDNPQKYYIEYESGGTDSTTEKFLFDIPKSTKTTTDILTAFIEKMHKAKDEDETLILAHEDQMQIETAFWDLWDDAQNNYPFLTIDMGFNNNTCWVVSIHDAARTSLKDAPKLFYQDGRYCRAETFLEAAEVLMELRPVPEES